MLKKLCAVPQLQLNFVRCKHNKKFLYNNAKYYEGVAYYPRTTDHQDAPVTDPPKLFRVQRIKAFKGNPYWDQKILSDLGLDKNRGAVAIVKNIPENNARLWKIKHLVKVDAIRFPYGEPTKDDTNHTFLKENGECLVTQQIAIDPLRIEAADKFKDDPDRLDKDTLQRDALMKWLNPRA